MCCYFPLPLTIIKYLHWVMQEWDETSQQANCFDKLFKPQVELINNLSELQLTRIILQMKNSIIPIYQNTISFRTITEGCIITSLRQHLQFITSMNAMHVTSAFTRLRVWSSIVPLLEQRTMLSYTGTVKP